MIFYQQRLRNSKKQNTSLADSIAAIKSVQNKLDNVIDKLSATINQKLNNILEKNKEFSLLRIPAYVLYEKITFTIEDLTIDYVFSLL